MTTSAAQAAKGLPAVSAAERKCSDLISAMLADPEWLLPIVAAQPQYRKTYYPLTAAALLEDVWFDAMANWVARTDPTLSMEKTRRGEPGSSGDYKVDGHPYSHKSGNGPQTTGDHWDALVAAQQGTGVWSSVVPMIYVGSGYGNLTGEWVPLGASATGSRHCRSVWPRPATDPRGRVPALTFWAPTGSAKMLAVWGQWPSFEEVWSVVARATAAGTPANYLELIWVSSKSGPSVGDEGRLEWTGRPGAFILPQALLQNVPTSSNNRATTIQEAVILSLMESAKQLGTWSPLPMWHAAFAPPRPPDLYLAQRAEFDRIFSPATPR